MRVLQAGASIRTGDGHVQYGAAGRITDLVLLDVDPLTAKEPLERPSEGAILTHLRSGDGLAVHPTDHVGLLHQLGRLRSC